MVTPRRSPLDFRLSRAQRYYCPRRGETRTVRFMGKCCVCGRRTYAADDGENDPRGILGDRASCRLEEAPCMPLCWRCADSYETYVEARRIAGVKA